MKPLLIIAAVLMRLLHAAAASSEGLEVVGAGFPRTGTSSLREALNILGYNTYHMQKVMQNKGHIEAWTAYLRGETGLKETAKFVYEQKHYTAAVDGPTCAVWKDLALMYPDAKIILTERSSAEKWWESASQTVLIPTRTGRLLLLAAPFWRSFGTMLEILWFKMFNLDHPRFLEPDDKHKVIEAYNRNSAEFRSVLELGEGTINKQRMLIYHVSQGWEPLCAFLDKPIPDVHFPNINSRKAFEQNMLKQGALFFLPLVLIVSLGAICLLQRRQPKLAFRWVPKKKDA